MNLELMCRRLAALPFLSAASAGLLQPCAGLAQVAYIPKSDNTIAVLDTAGGAVAATFTTGGGKPGVPVSLAVTPDGTEALVVEQGTNSVAVVTLATGQVAAQIAVGNAPGGIAVSPNGQQAYVVNIGDDTVSEVDLAAGTVSRSIPIGNSPGAIAVSPQGDKVVVANDGDNTVSLITVATGAVAPPIPVGEGPIAIAVSPDGTKAYTANNLDGSVSVINLASRTVTATIPVGSSLWGVAAAPDGTHVYVANDGGGTVSVIDVTTGTVTSTIRAEAPIAIAISPDGGRVFALNRVGGITGATLDIIDTANQTITGKVSFPDNVNGLAVTPDGATVLTADPQAGTFVTVSAASGSIANTIAVTPAVLDPTGIAVAPDGSRIYVTNYQANSVSVVSTATGITSTTIPVGLLPTAIALTPDGSKLYVADSNGDQPYGSGGVSIIDTATATVVGTLTLPNQDSPTNLAITQDGQTLYVTAEGDAAATYVFDTRTDQPLTAYPKDYLPGQASSVDTSPGGQNVYLAGYPIGSVTGFPASVNADWVRVSADGTKAFAAGGYAFEPVNLWILDVATGALTATVPLPGFPTGLDVTPDGSKVVVPMVSLTGAAGPVAIVDTATGAVIQVAVGAAPSGYGRFIAPPPLSFAAAVLPGARTVQVGSTATVFATLENGGSAAATGCAIGLAVSAPTTLAMTYQTTNPATNVPTGSPNMPVDIPAGAAQSFVLGFQDSAAQSIQAQALAFTCGGQPVAALAPGIDTVDLGFFANATQDIIVLAATAQPGVLVIPYSSGGGGAFSIATDNLGVAGTLKVSADTGTASLPLSISLCPTNPASGQCLQPAAASFPFSFAANATPTFSVFVGAGGPIAFAPGSSRIFVRFTDSNGISHGSTSVAVETQ